MLDAVAASADELQGDLNREIEELQEILRQHNSLDVVASVSLWNMVPGREGNISYAEYAALLVLADRYHEGEPLQRLQGVPVDDIQARVEKIFAGRVQLWMSESAARRTSDALDMFEELRFRAFGHGLFVRNMGYIHHVIDEAIALFGDQSNWMRKTLGFDVNHAISLFRAIIELVNARFGERVDIAREEGEALRRLVNALDRGHPVPDDAPFPENILRHLSTLDMGARKREIRAMLAAWVVAALGDSLAFTPEALSDRSGVDPVVCEAYLTFMSVGFGDVGADYKWPAATQPFQQRGMVRHDGRFVVVTPFALVHGLRARLEEAIKADAAQWEKYARRRGVYLEDAAVTHFAALLPNAKIYENLSYTTADGRDAELDVLVLFDNIAFLVECKAGTMSVAARRGDRLSMERDLKKLLVKSHDQALRAREYIRLETNPTFRMKDGKPVSIDKTKIHQSFLVSVTLDSLDVFSPSIRDVASLGLFNDGDWPWAVDSRNLRVIAEVVEFPAEFVHYLRRRLALNTAGLRVHSEDELDFLGHYLQDGLYFEELDPSLSMYVIDGSFTDAIDGYYEAIAGGTAASRPTQPIPAVLRQVIDELESESAYGYVDVICALLDGSDLTRKKIDKYISRVRAMTARDGKTHDGSIWFGDTAFTVMAGAIEAPDSLLKRLENYCTFKQQTVEGAASWVGIGTHLNSPNLISGWVRVGQYDATSWPYVSAP